MSGAARAGQTQATTGAAIAVSVIRRPWGILSIGPDPYRGRADADPSSKRGAVTPSCGQDDLLTTDRR